MISYSGLLQKLDEKGLTKTALAKEIGISSRTVAKIGRRAAMNTRNSLAAHSDKKRQKKNRIGSVTWLPVIPRYAMYKSTLRCMSSPL